MTDEPQYHFSREREVIYAYKDEVEGMRADIERLRAALQQIADLRYDYDCAPIDIARRALEPKP